ncbi:hypothetical protein VFPPC_15679 [Pochonia chlamydosporia 170]|uniref:Uncharacterized protein n=1 Tax=Pochonia chlamydosporia 170 TaxID=1380566 RepID=A0A179G071_METCM|nr:hypothetical protein VFPPC_15679 [Pochonia chlamydosporia 170]OAQ71294.1 hypothetical protein VFPPC_15679 [Pochonia chlamydosporia 170]
MCWPSRRPQQFNPHAQYYNARPVPMEQSRYKKLRRGFGYSPAYAAGGGGFHGGDGGGSHGGHGGGYGGDGGGCGGGDGGGGGGGGGGDGGC